MLRVRAITPITVPPAELVRRQARYDRFSPAGVAVTLEDIGPDAPSALDTPDDIRVSDRLVAGMACATDPHDFDVVLPDCVLDPGVDAGSTVPVVGMLRLSAGYAAALGPFGSMTRNAAIGDELTRRLVSYGLDGVHAGNAILDLDFDAIADDARWRAAIGAALDRLAVCGAVSVLNGCSAVELDGVDAGSPADRDPVPFDPARLALALLGAGRQAGLHPSRA